jgi:hypothetical protein
LGLRTLFSTATISALTILIATGCSQPKTPAAPVDTTTTAAATATPAPATAPAPAGAADNQTLDKMLERTMNRFAKLDLNGDGKLGPDELKATTAGGDRSGADSKGLRDGRSARAFARADANGDGTVTRAEAEAQTRKRFERLDANGDGKLAADERGANRGEARKAGSAE